MLMKYLFIIPLILATAMAVAAEPNKITHPTELQEKVNQLSVLQANYNGKYKRIEALLENSNSKISEDVAFKVVVTYNSIQRTPAMDYLNCGSGVFDCAKRDDDLRAAITDYKWAIAKLNSEIEYLNIKNKKIK